MKILEVHKFFYPHAGAETSLFLTKKMLESKGHEVIDFSMEDSRNVDSKWSKYFSKHRSYVDSNPLRKISNALSIIYSHSAKRRITKLINDTNPDIAHLHLISHQLTFSIVDALVKANIPIVMTLHDYKIACPAYTSFRNGNLCTSCTDVGNFLPAIRWKCHKDSYFASALVAIESSLSSMAGSWSKISHYIAPSEFASGMAIRAGVNESRITVLQNFLPSEELKLRNFEELSLTPKFFLACRLEEVKGVELLISEFSRSDVPIPGDLYIAGAGGELEDRVKIASQLPGSRIHYLGRLDRGQIFKELRSSWAVITPSLWPENNPFSILEARAIGVPVIASRVGGLPEMVQHEIDGLLYDSKSQDALHAALVQISSDPVMAHEMGIVGSGRLENINSAEYHYQRLSKIFESLVSMRRIKL